MSHKTLRKHSLVCFNDTLCSKAHYNIQYYKCLKNHTLNKKLQNIWYNDGYVVHCIMKTNLIYGLRDPRNDVYYYIGKTTVGNERPLKHLTNSHSKTVNEWVKQLEQLELVPYIDVLEKDIVLEELSEREKYWIEYYYEVNPELFNVQSLPETINRIKTQEDDDKFSFLVKVILDLGNILKTERLSRQLTQEELAKKSGVNRSTIILCENGNNTTINAVKKYLAALKGVDILTKNLDSVRVGKSRQKTEK